MECSSCGKTGSSVEKRPVDGGKDVPVCEECLLEAEKFYSQKEHEKDLEDMVDALNELIDIYDIQDVEKLPQHELASHLDSVVDRMFELREKIKQRKEEVGE